MHVAIDTRPLVSKSASRGIGMYTSHLVKHLHDLKELELTELTTGNVPENVDLIHYPWFDLFYGTLPLFRKLPTVVTIHDVTPLVLPDFYPTGIKGRLAFERQKLALRSVHAVMTDSEVSRRDIIKYLPIEADKVFTVHLAAQEGLVLAKTEKRFEDVKKQYKLPAEFVLYVGDINMNKNLITLIQACKKAEIPLAIVGKQSVLKDYVEGHAETADLQRLHEEYGKDEQVLRLGFVPTEDLGVLYQLATLYCQPSYYEGFGLPVLEAMQCGCPVLSSKRGSLPEIGGKAAIYAEPDVSGLVQGIDLIRSLSKTQRQRLIQEGKRQEEKFTWQHTARHTRQIYRQALRS